MDMREPGAWYPLARAMRREVHLHVGPTNSGKTYSAIQQLKAADSGVYCSPLRLLAWEVAEGLNNRDGHVDHSPYVRHLHGARDVPGPVHGFLFLARDHVARHAVAVVALTATL